MSEIPNHAGTEKYILRMFCGSINLFPSSGLFSRLINGVIILFHVRFFVNGTNINSDVCKVLKPSEHMSGYEVTKLPRSTVFAIMPCGTGVHITQELKVTGGIDLKRASVEVWSTTNKGMLQRKSYITWNYNK